MIQLQNFKKVYNKKIIIDNANCQFDKNKISFLMGKNGCGKTTLIKCLLNLESYYGNILFENKQLSDELRQKCMVIWDDTPFYSGLNGIENLRIFCSNTYTKNEIIELSSKYLNIETLKSKVKNYSYGQKKKLALILVELSKCDILIMDEITNGLDYESLKELKSLLLKWKLNKTIILTGHQLDFYNSIIDDVFLIKNARLTKSDLLIKNKNLKLEDIYDSQMY